MNPISYTKDSEGQISFRYDDAEWAEFHRLGKKDGNLGAVLTHINGIMYTYSCYGTNDHPVTTNYTLQLMHCELFDGPVQEPDWYLKPAAEIREKAYWEEFTKNARFIILDVSDMGESNVNIKHV